MKIKILTLFPDLFLGFKENSIIKRAIAKGVVEVSLINIRDYTLDKYGRVDSAPIGGGAGLIMKCQPILDSLSQNKSVGAKVILLSPCGHRYNQKNAEEYKKLDELVIICGHYEGIDERVNKYVDELVSVGDYILTGGEIGAMAIADSIIRLLDGAISEESLTDESFNNGLLEYPQYTEPFDYKGDKVPDLLYSGNHGAIEKWRKKNSLLLTQKYRPDLFAQYKLSKSDLLLLEEAKESTAPKWESDAIKKGHKFVK